MRTRKLGFALVAALVCAFVLAAPVTADAMVLRQGQEAVVRADETIRDDVYAFGSNVTIDGVIDGDVIAAGQVVVISGRVSGGVFGAGQVVRITGPVDGSVRAAGQTVTITGNVGGDALLAGADVSIAHGATVGRDVAVGATDVSVLGDTSRDLEIGATTAVIGGSVGGDARVQAKTIAVLPSADISGDLDYTSANKPRLEGKVGGTTTGHAPPKETQTPRETGGPAAGLVAFVWLVVAWVQGLVGMALFGLLLLLAFPAFMRRSTDAVMTSPWPSLGFGCLAVVVVPPIALMVFLLGLLLGGWWIAFVLMGVFGVALLIAPVVSALAFGTATIGRGKHPAHPIWLMLFGLAVIWVAGAIPFVGWLVGAAAGLFGLGALTVGWWRERRAQRPPSAPQDAAALAAPAPQPSPQAAPPPPAPPQTSGPAAP
jgi:cytoskeletal protein CcmA (bactofilin family)